MTTSLRLTKTQMQLLSVQQADEQTMLSVAAAIFVLGRGDSSFWGLPDDELRDVLQELHDTPADAPYGSELNRLLFRHYTAATGLKAILDMGGMPGQRAAVTKPRDWSVVDGRIELVPLPEIAELPLENPPTET